jgi:hypothetical protein
MKPLGEEAKKYCRVGHLLERPFLEQFRQHSMEGLTLGYKPIAMHETPVGTLLQCILLHCLSIDSIRFVDNRYSFLYNYLSLIVYNSI